MQSGTLADWVQVGLALVLVGISFAALQSWYAELRGTSRYKAREELVTAMRGLRYAFLDARTTIIPKEEYPPGYTNFEKTIRI